MNEKYYRANKELWDEFAILHYENESESYSVNSFLGGKTTLKSYELNEVGDVEVNHYCIFNATLVLTHFPGQEKGQ